mgnify:CR=1 FL=1
MGNADLREMDRGTMDPSGRGLTQAVESEVLNEADVDWKFVSHPGAKHSFTNKDAGDAGVPALEYNAEADRKSWAAMKDLFQQVFQN